MAISICGYISRVGTRQERPQEAGMAVWVGIGLLWATTALGISQDEPQMIWEGEVDGVSMRRLGPEAAAAVPTAQGPTVAVDGW
jgi:hypothetical protein